MITENLSKYDELVSRIQQELASAMKVRGHRVGLVTTVYGDELAWVVAERDLVFRLAQEARELEGLPRLTYDDLIKVEQAVAVSPDYFRDFAVKTANLVYGDPI